MAVIQKAVYINEVSGPQLSYKKPKMLRYDCDNITQNRANFVLQNAWVAIDVYSHVSRHTSLT